MVVKVDKALGIKGGVMTTLLLWPIVRGDSMSESAINVTCILKYMPTVAFGCAQSHWFMHSVVCLFILVPTTLSCLYGLCLCLLVLIHACLCLSVL